ncbi:MAG: ATP-grasp domain-containing protein [Syntrophales bacterium LBB04]|nr:ATP-grasp domain-containing protein [Syntrophales bacterium LBB04]
MTSEKLPILVTAIGGYGEQILKALRLAKGSRYYIIGADTRQDCPQFDLVDERITLPLANDPTYMDNLLDACDRFHIKALFYGCDQELKNFATERDRITKQGIFLPINPTHLIDICTNKEETNRYLSNLGFEAPKFVRALSKDDLRHIDWFPVVVKPSVGGGSANVYIAQNSTELLSLAAYLGLESVAENFLLQEYVGTPDDEYTVGILHDMDGNYINSIAVRRLFSGQLNIRFSVPNRTARTDLGSKLIISSGVSHGYVGRFPEVTKQCKEIAHAIGAKGPINIQCRLVDKKVKVFEINPRFSGTTSIRAMVGYNEPDVLLRKHVFGEETPVDFPYEEALVLRSLIEKRIKP